MTSCQKCRFFNLSIYVIVNPTAKIFVLVVGEDVGCGDIVGEDVGASSSLSLSLSRILIRFEALHASGSAASSAAIPQQWGHHAAYRF